MLTISDIHTLSRNPIFSNLTSLSKTPPSPRSVSKRFPCFRFQISKRFSSFCCQKHPMSSSSSSSSVNIVAEYAKSNRSSCKKCQETISAKALRLGLVSRDSHGFDMTRWHHLDCFPMGSGSVSVTSAETIMGFASLESNDQEALKKLVGQCDKSPEENEDLELLPVKIVAEYAKSNRSSCRKCQETISAKALRLGLVSSDSRGFDMTRWHHLDCFPMGSGSVSVTSPEAIMGFASLESNDQEALKKLVGQCDKSLEEDFEGGKDIVEGSKGKSSKQLRVHKTDGDEKNERDERNSKKAKLSTPNEEAVPDIDFSVSDIKNNYKDATLLPEWKAFQTVIFLERDDGLHDSKKIAAFDFDGCLAKTSVKRAGPDAWSLMYPSIPDKLRSLYNDGYKLVIFTNESNIERWKNKRQLAVDSKIGRLNNFIKHVKVPIQVFIACGLGKSGGQAEDPFRKPKPGMWQLMEQHFNSGILIDLDRSFYVGDAAGRKDDHSDADIKFAKAIGLKFHVPEEYFSA